MSLNKLACSTIHYYVANYPFKEALKSIAKIGYKGVETYIPPSFLQKEKDQFRIFLKDLGLEIASLSGKGVDWAAKDQRKLNKTMKSFKEAVLLAEDLGVERVITASGPCPKGMNWEEAFCRAAENLGEAADFAAQHGVKVLVEAVYIWLVKDTNSFLRFKELSGSKNIYANVDPSNYLLSNDDPQKALRRLKELVKGVHIKDSKKTDEGGLWTPIGEGEVDFYGFLKTIKEIGYKDWLVVEYEGGLTGKYYTDPIRASRDSFNYLKRLLKELK
jgi:sugar phosphate isomerase/epimerase